MQLVKLKLKTNMRLEPFSPARVAAEVDDVDLVLPTPVAARLGILVNPTAEKGCLLVVAVNHVMLAPNTPLAYHFPGGLNLLSKLTNGTIPKAVEVINVSKQKQKGSRTPSPSSRPVQNSEGTVAAVQKAVSRTRRSNKDA